MSFSFVFVFEVPYVDNGCVDVSQGKRKWFRLGCILIQIVILINLAILIHSGYFGNLKPLLVVSAACVGLMILWLTCDACHKGLYSDDEDENEMNHDVMGTTQEFDVVEIPVVEPYKGGYTFFFIELLTVMNIIISLSTIDDTRSYNEDIVILLSWSNVGLLLIACLFCYIYSTNLAWVLPLPFVVIHFHRFYPMVIKVDRNTVYRRNGELDEFLILEKYAVVPVDRAGDKQFLEEYENWSKFRVQDNVDPTLQDPTFIILHKI